MESLPTETLLHIFSFFDIPTWCRAQQVCDAWRRLCLDHQLCTTLYHSNISLLAFEEQPVEALHLAISQVLQLRRKSNGNAVDYLLSLLATQYDQVVRKVVEQQPQLIRSFNRAGHAPIHTACFLDNGIALRHLLTADRNASELPEQNYQQRPLHVCCARGGRINALKELLRYRPNVKARDRDGYTALHLAIMNNCSCEFIQLLLEHGAPTDAVAYPWGTPLRTAQTLQHKTIVKLLAEHEEKRYQR